MRASLGPWDTFASSPGLRPQSALHTALQRECCLPENPLLLCLSFSWLILSADTLLHPACVTGTQWWAESIKPVIQTGTNQMVNRVHQASNTDRHEPNAPVNVPALGWHVFLPWDERSHRGQNLPRCNVGCPFVPISRGKLDCDPCSVFPLDLVFPPNSSF